MLRCYTCDLHVHTCLSPCAELEMHPAALVRTARERGIDLVAVSDHNASENVPHVMEAAEHTGLAVLPAMEVCSREEVHVLALFENCDDLNRFQKLVYDHLPGKNDERVFGLQPEVNARGEVEGFNPRLLIGATTLSLDDCVRGIHARGGLAVAAHIDRPSYSVLSQLGFIPPEVAFDALEISSRLDLGEGRERYGRLAPVPLITSSDAHRLRDIGIAPTRMLLGAPCLREIRLAFTGTDGRKVI